MHDMTIGTLAKAAGVGVETVRYYQRRGLLTEPERPRGGVRRYGATDAARLRFIRRAQELGFTLEEIRQLLRVSETPNCRDARAISARKLAIVETRIADLARIRSALKNLIGQCDAGALRSCPIIDALGRPGQGK